MKTSTLEGITMKPTLTLLAAMLLVSRAASAAEPFTVDGLQCEMRDNPVGVDAQRPRFRWIMESQHRGQRQTAYRVLVATDKAALERSSADCWDSGEIRSDQSAAVPYAGKPLVSCRQYWWKVSVWDQDQRAVWSEAATFLTGKLRQEDWRGQWIGPDLDRGAGAREVLGFAAEARRADSACWVQVDLGKPQRIDRIVLHPMRHKEDANGPWINGYGFPLRFRIAVAADAQFSEPIPIADCTAQDYTNPGWAAVAFDAQGKTARYVRLTATKLWPRGPGRPFVLTLGELEVFAGTRNIAAGAAVEANASVEGYGWAKKQLTDGLALCGPGVSGEPAHQHGAIYLRKTFELARPAVRALISFSGLGFSELAIDGRKVGDYVIGPGFVDYDHRVPYLMFDVSDRFAAPGPKQLDVVLADGWYALKRDPWVHKLETKPYVDLPKLRLDLVLVHADGSQTHVVSDESWRWSTGEITRSWIPEEDIDLRKARDWRPVVIAAAPRGRLTHQKEPFNHIVEEFRPPTMDFDAKTGTATYDLGREVNGHVRLQARGPAGTTIRITTTPTEPRSRTSTFTLAGTGAKEIYEPRFFHAGMKRVTVSGLVEKPAPDDLVICRISSLRTPAGSFRCSDDYVNGLEQAVRRTAVEYTTFLPNDPVREWKAWTQDIQNMFGSSFYLFAESQTLYRRWQYDLLDSQRADGNMANVAPGPVFDPYNSPWWGGCGVWLPWEWRLVYGDDQLLRDSYPAMKRYVDFLDKEAAKTGGLGDWGLLDWLPVEETPRPLINTPAHYHFAQIVAQTAAMLGQRDDEHKYTAMAQRVRELFNRTFLDTATGIYGQTGWKPKKGNWNVPGGLEKLHELWWTGDRPCTQAGQVLPLALNLVPEQARAKVEAALLREITAHKGRLSTGFVSTPYLLEVLADLDPEACWRMVTAREFPSWHSMTLGSKNDLLKETWAGGMALMPSLGGSVARWCYRSLGGIRPHPDAPGFKKIIIKPSCVSALEWVECHHDSPYGRITSNWKREGGRLTMEVVIPPNTTATVFVPAKDASDVTESGKPIAQVEGVKFLGMRGGNAVYAVDSGLYRFQSTFPRTTK